MLTDCFDGHSRSRLTWFLLLMYRRGVIDGADLTGFSDELRDEMSSARGEGRGGVLTSQGEMQPRTTPLDPNKFI
jgi:hypothetical protein